MHPISFSFLIEAMVFALALLHPPPFLFNVINVIIESFDPFISPAFALCSEYILSHKQFLLFLMMLLPVMMMVVMVVIVCMMSMILNRNLKLSLLFIGNF